MYRLKPGALIEKMTVLHFVSFSTWIGLVVSMPPTTAKPEGKFESYNICNSSVCLQKAKEINESIDPCINPCDDFYAYACGGWISKHAIPESKASYGTFDVLTDELRATIRELDKKEDEKAAIQHIMKERGLESWPVTCKNGCTGGHSNWSKVLLKAGIYSVLEIYVDKDSERNFSYALQMDQISFSTVGRNQLIHPEKPENEAIIAAYKKLIITAIQFFSSNITEHQAKDLADTMVKFQGELANLTAPPEERRDIFSIYRRTTVGELQKNFSDFPLLGLLNKEFSKINVTLNTSETLELYALSYYTKLVEFLRKANRTKFFNYVGMNAILYWARHASKSFRNATFELKKAKTGVTHDIERWEKCVRIASSVMQEVVGHLYVKKKFSQEAKKEVEYLVRRLKEVFNETIRNATWMDNVTKSEAEKKLTKMRSKIAYPDWILNTTYLKQLYKHVPRFNRSSSFLSMWRAITENNWMRAMEKLRAKYDPEVDWVEGPAVVNAFYNPLANEMVYPSGILQSPFYKHGLPRSINFGAIGMVVGHELTHGFDDTGSQYDAYGGLRHWWSNRTRTQFDKKAECFVNQYGSICDEEANMTLNGKNTVGENIADNGGLRTAFLAYEKVLNEDCERKDTRLQGLEELSGEKLLFIGSAMVWCSTVRPEQLRSYIQYDPHSPDKYRVNMPMRNLPQFATVFNCSIDSPMNPNRNETCTLW
ncbi:neprilysin-1-like isoform X2 [Haemaphysalis longicornis]